MKLKITLAFLLSLGLAGCGGEVTKEKSAEQALVIPSWLQNNAADQKGINAVVTVSNVLGKQVAINEAFADIDAEVQLLLNEARDAQLVNISNKYTGLEKDIRLQVARGLPVLHIVSAKVVATFNNPKTGDISVWAQLSDARVSKEFKALLAQVDAHLKYYTHVSGNGSSLTQMLSILPALPTLELRSKLKYYLAEMGAENKNIILPNDQQANLLDLQLSNKFSDLVMTIDATTDDSLHYEYALTKQLQKVGFNLSARKPDLLVKYFIEKEDTVQNGLHKVVLVTDAEIVDNKGVTIATVSQEYQALNSSEKLALESALQHFSTDIMAVVVASAIDFMDKVNRDIPLPIIDKR